MVYADMHVHTNASDGRLSLEEIVEEAKKQDVKAVAITDHDTVNPQLREKHQTMDGVGVVTGAEVKAVHRGVEIEILCYFLEPGNHGLQKLFEEMNARRLERMDKMVERFNSLDKEVGLELEDIVELSTGSVGRPHFARAIVESGLESDFWTAFKKYASRESPCYMPLEKPDVSVVMEGAKKSGARTSLAHPCNENIEDFRGFIKGLVDMGLDGCEVNYPYYKNNKNPKMDPVEVETVTEELGLIKTGGSDFHDRENFTVGKRGVGKDIFDSMKDMAGIN